MSNMPFPFPEVAEKLYITSSYDEYDNITKYHLLKKESFSNHVESSFHNINSQLQGTHAQITNLKHEEELEWAKEAGTAWYRSKEPLPIDHPFVGDGYLSNKKWPLIEGNTMSNIITYDNTFLNLPKTPLISAKGSVFNIGLMKHSDLLGIHKCYHIHKGPKGIYCQDKLESTGRSLSINGNNNLIAFICRCFQILSEHLMRLQQVSQGTQINHQMNSLSKLLLFRLD